MMHGQTKIKPTQLSKHPHIRSSTHYKTSYNNHSTS